MHATHSRCFSSRILSSFLPLPLSSQALAECRAAIQSDAALDDLRDATLARYLRHNSWHVEPAIKQMKEYLVSEARSNAQERQRCDEAKRSTHPQISAELIMSAVRLRMLSLCRLGARLRTSTTSWQRRISPLCA